MSSFFNNKHPKSLVEILGLEEEKETISYDNPLDFFNEADDDDNGGDNANTDSGTDTANDNNNDNSSNDDSSDTNSEDNTDDNSDDNNNDESSDDDFKIDANLDSEDDDNKSDDSSSDTSTDTSSLGGSTDTEAEPVKANTDIFSSLSNEEQTAKILELKRLYKELYSACDDIIGKINDIDPCDQNIEIISRVSGTVYNLKMYISDYLKNTFASKSYVENDINFNRFLVIINSLRSVLEDIAKIDQSAKEK